MIPITKEDLEVKNTPFTILSYSQDDNTNPKDTIPDSNNLYQEILQSSSINQYPDMLNNLEDKINSMINMYKAEGIKYKPEIVKTSTRPDIKETKKQNRSLLSKSVCNRSESINKKEFIHLQNENISLIQKLNKKKAKIASQRELLKNMKKQCIEQCNESNINNEPSLPPKRIKETKKRDEVKFLKNELAKKNSELSKSYLEIKLLKNDLNKIDNIRKDMYMILEAGAHEYDYLKGIQFKNDTTEELFEQTSRLVGYLINEKKQTEMKYKKLLELHNNLIGKSGDYSLEYIYKVKDENISLKKDLELICSKKMYKVFLL